MTLSLLHGKYEKVLEKYDELVDDGKFLNRLPLHLAALCAKKQVSSVEKVVCSETVLEESFEFLAAQRLCREEKEKSKLQEMLDRNREWRLSQKKEKIVSEKIEQVPAAKNKETIKEPPAPEAEIQKHDTEELVRQAQICRQAGKVEESI